MNNRLKVFGVIALIGFLAGVLAQVTATYILPSLSGLGSALGAISPFIISGLAGAVITVLVVGVWAYLTGRKEAAY